MPSITNRLLFRGLVPGALVFLLSTSVQADRNNYYWLLQAGVMQLALNDAEALYTLGSYAGYRISERFSMEGEIVKSLKGGFYTSRAGQGHYALSTAAIYGVLRMALTPSSYLKTKLGVLYERVEHDSPVDVTLTRSATGFSGGAGLGFVLFDGLGIELELNRIEADVLYYSIGVHVSF